MIERNNYKWKLYDMLSVCSIVFPSNPESRNGGRGPRTARRRRSPLASFRKDLEKFSGESIPALEDIESGKLVGAILPLSEQAQMQMRNSIEVIEYLLNQERVVWS